MPNAKKPKTGSARKPGLGNIAYLLIGILSLFAVLLMPSSPSKPYARTCISGSCFRLEYAITPEQQERGLSGRDTLPEHSGMLFVLDEPVTQCMWMKDMRFSLDMVWLDQQNRVSKILRNIGPDSFPESFCSDSTKYVIEFNSGVSDKLNLHIGDLIQL